MADDDIIDLTDRHLGENATVQVALRVALDLWNAGAGIDPPVHAFDEFTAGIQETSLRAGFGSLVDAMHRCRAFEAGADELVTIPLRTALDLLMVSDGHDVFDEEGFRDAVEQASEEAGFDGWIEAFHRCGPGVLTSADGRRGRPLPR